MTIHFLRPPSGVHADQVSSLREQAVEAERRRIDIALAADLLEAHDDTGISLDDWVPARSFVERHTGQPITKNGI